MQHNRAKKQKGSTLVEVLVALSVFLIVMGSLVAGYLSAKRVVQKQKEFVYFEAICDDIGEYGKLYGKQWDTNYFVGSGNNTITVYRYNSDGNKIDDTTDQNSEQTASSANSTVAYYKVYFDAKFVATNDESAKYCMTYKYEPGSTTKTASLVIESIENTISNYVIIENLNYGSENYDW